MEPVRFYPKRYVAKAEKPERRAKPAKRKKGKRAQLVKPAEPESEKPRVTMEERFHGMLQGHAKNAEHWGRVKLERIEAERAIARNYRRKRRAEDPAFKLLGLLRSRLYAALKGKGKKSMQTERLLGCSAAQLKEHLAEQFLPGMTWENHGLWEIDHVRPCASFDLSCREQQKDCFHFSNLQPLWKPDNRAKRDQWKPNL